MPVPPSGYRPLTGFEGMTVKDVNKSEARG